MKKHTDQFNKQNPHQKVEVPRASTLLDFFRKINFIVFEEKPPGGILFSIGALTSLLMVIPILYVLIQAARADQSKWARLLDGRIPELLWNTMSLTIMVTLSAVLLGVSLAWFVHRTDLPGRRFLKVLLSLPLVVPPYVGAVTYIIFLGPSGRLKNIWDAVGFLPAFPFNPYSFWGVVFVLTMFTYPYVYLITGSTLNRMNRNYEEVARSQGLSTWGVFFRVNLPFLRPAIGASAILVALYALSDFGAVAMLRYVTFTAAIYFQRAGFDTESASILSLVLVILTLLILYLESMSRRRTRFSQTPSGFKQPQRLALGKWRLLVTTYAYSIFILSVVVPVSVLVYWTIIGLGRGAIDTRFIGFAWNSLQLSTWVALFSMMLALPLVYLKGRYPSRVTRLINRLAYGGYALPGVIVALGFVFVFNNHIPLLYNTVFMLSLAFIVRFLPQAMQAADASLALVSPKIDEAARSLGHPPWKVMYKVTLPAILPGLLSGGALVFVSAIKELPATLMLRPPGFDTLAVRVYFEASEAIYHQAAPAALIIIGVSIFPLRFLINKY
ncbi:iron(III) ABC transporter permease [Halolactibacillus alkaliphilus]|uniref:Iron(III) ABC transporter permease n=1 Tax=Halolactibacillus alkaliphilus TaxID=442899 RepID=A0A511X033_9BACI|nr:iron ABC transporter permease [Halolactibacillus alkaliphilus]GEN56281.1 iron(III) ABC transporter permease [Halolactibacillus alkaliphilus]GGN66227.1 iron(III) ABC transporter permease [Halolactibacillus alkaliphilus]SFO67331.1 iron(III) transport system permease protein [Halolactibacillus alkaliphilus]